MNDYMNHNSGKPAPVRVSGATAQVIALSELAGPKEMDAGAEGAAPALAGANPLHQIKATLQVCVGSASLTVAELLAAKEHQVLTLDRTVQQPVDLLLEGQVVARGQLVAVDGHFGVRVTELPVPLGLHSAART